MKNTMHYSKMLALAVVLVLTAAVVVVAPQAAFANGAGPMTMDRPSVGAGPGAGPGQAPTQPVIGTINIVITDQGINPSSTIAEPGLYDVVIINQSSGNRGVHLTGPSLCCTDFTRFSNILAPGQSDRFQWFFAPGQVTIRTFSSATRTATAFTNVNYTGNVAAVNFQTGPGGAGAGPGYPVPAQPLLGTVNITITNQGFEVSPQVSEAGLYNVVITNRASRNRGVELIGPSLCCTEYNRFSEMLRPGQSDTFRWFFAPGQVTARSYSSATKTATAFTNIDYTGHVTTFTFR